jgi:hypothetical protein
MVEPRTAPARSAALRLVGVAVALAGVWSPFRDLRVLSLAVVAVAAAVLDLYRHRLAWQHLGSPKKAVAAVLTLAAVPVFSFWTQTSFLPSQNRASLTAGVAIEFVEAPDGSGHAVVEITLTNPSDVRALVVLTNLTVCHWADEQDRADPEEELLRGQSRCERLVPPFAELSWVDPGAELTHRTSLERRSGGPLLEVLFRIAYGRADRMVEVVEPEPEVTPEQQGRCASATIVNLEALSRLESLARHGLALMYADIDGDGGRTYLIGSGPGLVCRREADLVERTSGLHQHFGLTETRPQWVGWPPAGETP